MKLLALASIALAASNALFVVVLVAQRLLSARRERQVAAIEARLRPRVSASALERLEQLGRAGLARP